MAEAVAANPPGPDYGLDAPIVVKRMFTRGGWLLAFAIGLWIINHDQYPAPSQRLLSVLGSAAIVFWCVGGFMIWSSRVGKIALRDRLLDLLDLKGDEKILDAGCGRGLMLVGAAKRLKSGKATGIDVWSAEDLSGNTADACKQNAKIEGVSDKVRIETGDVRRMVYPASNYDAVMSTLVIHNLPEKLDRDQAIREMWRVLKPGGKLLIYDIFNTGEYAKLLRELGALDLQMSATSWLWCVPSRSLFARKP